MEAKLDQLITIVSKISEDIKDIKTTQAEHSQRLTVIQDITMENQRFINALSQDVARTATKESMNDIKANIEVLNTRLFQQESKIVALTIAK